MGSNYIKSGMSCGTIADYSISYFENDTDILLSFMAEPWVDVMLRFDLAPIKSISENYYILSNFELLFEEYYLNNISTRKEPLITVNDVFSAWKLFLDSIE